MMERRTSCNKQTEKQAADQTKEGNVVRPDEGKPNGRTFACSLGSSSSGDDCHIAGFDAEYSRVGRAQREVGSELNSEARMISLNAVKRQSCG